MKKSVYSIITEQIVKRIEESGQLPWQKPWREIGAYNVKSGKEYSYLNQMMLQHSGGYLTFNQIQELDGTLQKNAKSEIITFYKTYDDKKEIQKDENGNVLLDDNGKPKHVKRFALRYYRVFSLVYVDGIEGKHINLNDSIRPIENAEAIMRGYITRSGVKFQSEPSDSAFYAPAIDLISVPNIKQFENPDEYYSTVFHEAVHSTGHKKRLSRKGFDSGMRFGSCDYSREELVAEIGSCFLRRKVRIEDKRTFENSVSYIDNWLNVLKRDDHMIVTAARQAEKAVRYILNETPDHN